jgi:hypothetical protein
MYYMDTIIPPKPKKTGIFARIMTIQKNYRGSKMTTGMNHYLPY